MRIVPTLLLMTLIATLTACDQESGTTQQTSLEASLGSISRNSSHGAELTRKKCGSCHWLDRSLRKIGPPLKGIYGRAPSISGVPFAVWDEASLDKWLTSPRSVKKSTRMAIPGISDAAERKAIIDYLKLI